MSLNRKSAQDGKKNVNRHEVKCNSDVMSCTNISVQLSKLFFE